MRKTLKIKSIVFDDGNEIPIIQKYDKSEGIIFELNDSIRNRFDVLRALKKTVSIDRVVVKNNNNKYLTLFNCFYIVKVDKELYIHLVFNEIVEGIIKQRNFDCNKLKVTFFCDDIFKRDLLQKLNIYIDTEGVTIKHTLDYNKYVVFIESENLKKRDELYKFFSIYFELINIIIGYFPLIKKTQYYTDKTRIFVENEIVDKYITDKKYKYYHTYFLKRTTNEEFKVAYLKYLYFCTKNDLQMSLYFMATMKSNSYVELDVVNILQTFDGIYDGLNKFKNTIIEFPEKMNKDIINQINEMDFSKVNNKYGVSIDINKRISSNISRMNYIVYRKKLKNFFKYNNYIVFKEERKRNNHPFIKYDTLIEKCVNTRNKFSHVINNNNYLYELENSTYIHKFILIFRLHILDEIGLSDKFDQVKLNFYISVLNNYIKNILK